MNAVRQQRQARRIGISRRTDELRMIARKLGNEISGQKNRNNFPNLNL